MFALAAGRAALGFLGSKLGIAVVVGILLAGTTTWAFAERSSKTEYRAERDQALTEIAAYTAALAAVDKQLAEEREAVARYQRRIASLDAAATATFREIDNAPPEDDAPLPPVARNTLRNLHDRAAEFLRQQSAAAAPGHGLQRPGLAD